MRIPYGKLGESLCFMGEKKEGYILSLRYCDPATVFRTYRIRNVRTRSEREEIALWAILAKEPACRGG